MCFRPTTSANICACRILYKLDGAGAELQVGLTQDEVRELDAMSLPQLLAELKRAKLAHKGGRSQYLGVCESYAGKWQARYGRVNVGRRNAMCDSEEEAARMYDTFVLHAKGRYAFHTTDHSDCARLLTSEGAGLVSSVFCKCSLPAGQADLNVRAYIEWRDIRVLLCNAGTPSRTFNTPTQSLTPSAAPKPAWQPARRPRRAPAAPSGRPPSGAATAQVRFHSPRCITL